MKEKTTSYTNLKKRFNSFGEDKEKKERKTTSCTNIKKRISSFGKEEKRQKKRKNNT